jgi:hypothetical protein
MEPILSKKVKGGIERVVLQNAFLNLTVTFKRETVDGDGTATAIDYPTEQAQVQFDAEMLANLGKADLAAMLEQLIKQTKAKYK